jgi:hypothetical protein
MDRDVAQLSALAVNAKMPDASAIVQIPHGERAELGSTHGVIEKRRQNGTVAFGL